VKRILRVAVVPALALGALSVLAAPAGAQPYPPAGTCSLGVSNSSVPQGGQTTVSTTGGPSCCAAGSTVTLELNRLLETVTADANGQFSTIVTIPSDTTVGAHTITATCAGAAGLVAALTVTGGAAQGGLAFTGSDSIPLVWIGLALLTLGASLVFALRRRASIRPTG
jgi:LPXTG-motif cell wall-anchored protein